MIQLSHCATGLHKCGSHIGCHNNGVNFFQHFGAIFEFFEQILGFYFTKFSKSAKLYLDTP